MASLMMTASFLGSSAANTMSRYRTMTVRHGVVRAKAARMPESPDHTRVECIKRRDMMFAVASTAVCSIAKAAMADEEPKRGTPEAKKKYAAICVTMPTASVCHK